MHLHFVQSTEPLEGGGLGRAAVELSNALNRLDLRSRLITTDKRNEVSESVRSYQRKGPTRLFYSEAMRREAVAIVSEAEVVHGHGFYVSPNWLMGGASRRLGKPLVYHPHGMFEPWILSRSRWKKRVAHFLFEDANFRHAQLWRALTDKEAHQIRAQGITAPIVVCPNGIDLEIFDSVPGLRAATSAPKARRSLLFLGRLHPKKGLDLLVQAWSTLPESLRRAWKIVIAGPDELGHRAEVEALNSSLGLEEDISFVGSVSGDAKVRVLAEADAFILPSRSEGFSVAILEAMACSLPVIATTACNFPTLATVGGGWSCEADATSIARALTDLLRANEIELSQRGAASRRLVAETYTWPSIAKTIDGACRRLVKA